MLRTSRFVTLMAMAGLMFLYIPILLMMVLSFNGSRLVSVWGGFSTKWYGELLGNDQLLNAAWLSIKVAGLSATLAVVLGTLAGYVLTRFGPFRGRVMMAGMATAPLVMPEVITGLALLLLFVAMEDFIGWPQGRSLTTIVIAHATFCMAYVTIVVQSRLAQMDGVLEEAAQDLGARPWRAFVDVTLPMLAPAPVSTSTSWPWATYSRTEPGVRPTRYSWFLISLGHPTRILVLLPAFQGAIYWGRDSSTERPADVCEYACAWARGSIVLA